CAHERQTVPLTTTLGKGFVFGIKFPKKRKIMLHKETVSSEMWKLLQTLIKDEMLKDFNLVGGTALSLQIGHRLSIDIDLFTTKGFDKQKLLKHLVTQYP